jgi:hypothetical protein
MDDGAHGRPYVGVSLEAVKVLDGFDRIAVLSDPDPLPHDLV